MGIIRLGYSSFFSKCCNFHGTFRNAIKYTKKFSYFLDNDASISCGKFGMFRQEYLSSVVNVLTNNVKISDETKADLFELKLSRIHEKIG